MPHWLLKSALHRAASLLPQRQALNRLLQRISGSLVLTPEGFAKKVAEAQRHYDYFRAHSPGAPAAFTAFELGTGWYPIIPLALHLRGAETIWTFDIEPLVAPTRLAHVLSLFVAAGDSGQLDAVLPGWNRERLEAMRGLLETSMAPAEVLSRLNIHLRVQDARSSGLDAGSAHLVTSSGVLMLIPQPVLAGIYAEFRRVCHPAAVMVHRLNLRDTFCYFDRSITPFNMLRFSPAAWRWLDSPLVPQNRLRVSDHRTMLDAAGFRLVEEQSESGSLEELRRVPLAPEFRGYSEDDLRVVETWLVAAPP